MQGRLLPKYRGRYQAHPVGYWQDEFSIAAGFGLNLIEFILDYNNVYENPVMNESGIDEILALSDKTGIAVKSICADYFMEAPLHISSDMVVKESQKVLETLITNSPKLGVCDIVIPCVDQATLASNNKNIGQFVSNVRSALNLAEKLGVNLALETDLAPGPFSELIESFNSPQITVNYDTGNSASLGYDPEEELKAYGGRISDIHIKDRLLNGGSVILGSGNSDFERFFAILKKVGYEGPFIMQAYRDDEGLEVFSKQLQWIMPFLKNYGSS
jgi:sugar phosphate isomerase/epimerase